MLRLVFEMETSDPDDFMTLLWLADHPAVELLGVLVTPGSRDQCQLVRWGLDACDRTDVPIGALHGPSWWDSTEGQKTRVSGFHAKVYGEAIHHHAPGSVLHGPTLLAALLAKPGVTVLVGAPPKNTGALLRVSPDTVLPRWVQQGGFAGDSLVAKPLAKFQGHETRPSFNPGGAPRDTLALLASPRVHERVFVSKNVCHGVLWDTRLQHRLKSRLSTPRKGLRWMLHALDRYLQDKGTAKAMHDLVAAACALTPEVCTFREVELYRQQGEWGARAAHNTQTFVSVDFDEDRFVTVLAQ